MSEHTGITFKCSYQKLITVTISLDIYLLICIKTATMQPVKDTITYNFKVIYLFSNTHAPFRCYAALNTGLEISSI